MYSQSSVIWKKIDDGSGFDVFYVNLKTGARSRSIPESYELTFWSDTTPRYVFRNKCIKCRKKLSRATVHSTEDFKFIFCFNSCPSCLVEMVGDDLSMSSYEALHLLANEPKSLFVDLSELDCSLRGDATNMLYSRNEIAFNGREITYQQALERRNEYNMIGERKII